jgi:hypothetical protein
MYHEIAENIEPKREDRSDGMVLRDTVRKLDF